MNFDKQRASFETWATKYIGDPLKYHKIPAWLAYRAALSSPEVKKLQKDAERLNFITDPESAWRVQSEKRTGKPIRYRMIDDGVVFGKWYRSARKAIDAAMEKKQK